jgi:hypothetical protein
VPDSQPRTITADTISNNDIAKILVMTLSLIKSRELRLRWRGQGHTTAGRSSLCVIGPIAARLRTGRGWIPRAVPIGPNRPFWLRETRRSGSVARASLAELDWTQDASEVSVPNSRWIAAATRNRS